MIELDIGQRDGGRLLIAIVQVLSCIQPDAGF